MATITIIIEDDEPEMTMEDRYTLALCEWLHDATDEDEDGGRSAVAALMNVALGIFED